MKFEIMKLNNIKLGKNSRMSMDNADLSELMSSIKERGLLQPIGVKKTENGKGYEVVYGYRRFMAVSKLGLSSIPVVIREEGEKEFDSDMDNLTENIQRKNISLAEAGRYMDYLNKSMTLKEIAARLSISVSYVRSCIESYKDVPESYRNDLEVRVNSNRKKKTPGKIPINVAQKIVNAQKKYHLNQEQVKTLFSGAKTKDEFVTDNIPKYALALKQGKNDYLKDERTPEMKKDSEDIHRNKGFGYSKKLEDGRKLICMIRCFECGRENYAPAVATGWCAWCGHNPNPADLRKRDE